MKKWLCIITSILIVVILAMNLEWISELDIAKVWSVNNEVLEESNKSNEGEVCIENDVEYHIKTEGEFFYIFKNGEWEKIFFAGVNIGAGKPGCFPGELGISYDEYIRWFEQISLMNANCIRVYTILPPHFYSALNDYNETAENPLYLFQGVWMNEEDITIYADVYAENNKIKNKFIEDALDCVDVIHGNITLSQREGFASGTYTTDVSKWLAGWILGIEYDPKFILNTNQNNIGRDSWDGQYLYTYGSTPFEAFLCETGDKLIDYQTRNYKYQTTLAFSNWVTTDPLAHPQEPHADEDLLTLNTESIKNRKDFHSNMFASYHVYPYYPDLFNYQKEYINYVDDVGKKNPYEAYLKDLKMAHTMPIVVSEFGLPTSRGTTHESVMGYHQGGIAEHEQGVMIVDMLQSIYDCKYAGAMLFTWQDEWFKRTWNNISFDIADQRASWSNVQTSEQMFGILTFDPGKEGECNILDGCKTEWIKDNALLQNDVGKLYVNSDERYVHFMIETSADFDFENDTIIIPIDIIGEQGNTKCNDSGVKFDRGADFLIKINGEKNARIVCDAYYDAFYFQSGYQFGMLPNVEGIETKDSGNFNPMRMCTNFEMQIPISDEKIPFGYYETGKLTYGVGDPNSKNFNSIADYCHNENCIEVRIPWQLLNIMDPSNKMVMDDFYKLQSFSPISFDDIWIGLGDESSDIINIEGKYNYKKWQIPEYHERLKKSYYAIQKYLGGLAD